MKSTSKTLLSGIFFTAIARYSGIVISLAVTAVLARLIAPDEFGIVAIATVIISFFAIFTDMGISPAIVQNRELSADDLSSIFSFTIWCGAILSITFFLSSWLIADYYDSPMLRVLCQLLSVNLFFSSANIVPNALLSRNKEFKFIALRSFAIQVTGGIAAIIAALLGAGVYALVINPILSSLLIFTISYKRYPQQLRFSWGRASIRKIFNYSAYQFMFSFINYFSRNFDKLFIGKYMGLAQLGYYEKSYRLMMLPLQNITYVITPVMHPVFSDMQNDIQKLASSYERVVRVMAFIGFPLSVFLVFTAQELTLILFGDQWYPSIPVFQILAMSVGLQIILSSSGSIFQAANDTKSLFICGVFSGIMYVAGVLVGTLCFGTLEAVGYFTCLACLINFAQCYWQMYRVTLKRSMLPFLRKLLSPLLLGGLTTAVLLPLSIFLEGGILLVNLIVKSSVFLCIFGCYIQWTKEFDILGKAKSVLKKR